MDDIFSWGLPSIAHSCGTHPGIGIVKSLNLYITLVARCLKASILFDGRRYIV